MLTRRKHSTIIRFRARSNGIVAREIEASGEVLSDSYIFEFVLVVKRQYGSLDLASYIRKSWLPGQLLRQENISLKGSIGLSNNSLHFSMPVDQVKI